MPECRSAPRRVAWKGDPEKYRLAYPAIRLARDAPAEHFSEANGIEENRIGRHDKVGMRHRASERSREPERRDDGRSRTAQLTKIIQIMCSDRNAFAGPAPPCASPHRHSPQRCGTRF